MTPHLELGIGLMIGVFASALVFLTVNVWRSKRTFKSTESVKALVVAERILDEIEALAVIIDESTNPVFANHVAREYDRPELLDKQLNDPKMPAIIFEVLSTGQAFVKEPEDPTALGALRLRIFPFDDYHVIAIADDVSATSRLLAMRRDFIANMSHELKTPIAAIGLLSEAIAKASNKPEMVQRFTEKLGNESRRLGELSHDIIRLSEAQAPLTTSDREPVDLASLTSQEVAAHTSLADQKGIEIKFINRLRRKQDGFVIGKADSLRSAVANLIANAVAHSPTGETVKVTFEALKGGCYISVEDNGPGIDPQFHNRIFERFFRVDPARSRTGGGTGLGLSIVRNTARTHGGDVTVESKVGAGAKFVLFLPGSLSKEHLKKKKSRQHQLAKASRKGVR